MLSLWLKNKILVYLKIQQYLSKIFWSITMLEPSRPVLNTKILQTMMLLIVMCTSFELKLVSPLPSNKGTQLIYSNSELNPEFNDYFFKKITTCTNELFTIVQFNKTDPNPIIEIVYDGIIISQENIFLTASYDEPYPHLEEIDELNKTIRINAGCLGDQTTKQNYFNKLNVEIIVLLANPQQQQGQQIQTKLQFSLLYGCDKGGRNKKFEYGYIFIALINAAITIGVALHSKIWSIRFAGRPLSFELKWPRFIVLIVIIILIGVIFYILAADEFKQANNGLRYLGLFFGYIFTFICSNEIFFLIRYLKFPVFKFLRRCDLISIIVSTIMFIIGFVTDSWIYYNIIALAICVGAIKMLRFSTMKQAFLSMLISVITVSTMAIILHFILERSYNDYATELNSPLFIMIPDMVDQLYKKCSWLPVVDVIIPGVFLSFLRTYDQNYNTGWGGVYTVIGNLSFISSTILWIVLQVVYPYSIPFSLITYSLLSLSIFIISMKRNELQTLWQGRFNGANNEISAYLLKDDEQTNRNSFGDMVGQDIINQIKIDVEKQNEEQAEAIQGENKSKEEKKWRSSIK